MKGKTLIILSLIVSIAIVMTSCGTAQIPQVGDKAPDFSLKNIDGKNISLSDFSGKRIALILTSTDCSWCLDEMPYLEAAYRASGEKLMVLTIYRRDNLTDVRKFVTKNQLTTFPALADPDDKVFKLYGPQEIWPINILIDAEGVIKNVKPGAFKDQKEVQSWLEST